MCPLQQNVLGEFGDPDAVVAGAGGGGGAPGKPVLAAMNESLKVRHGSVMQESIEFFLQDTCVKGGGDVAGARANPRGWVC